jgi:hypothetical protein
MFEDDMSAGETATSYTNDFVDAAIAKLDKVFGNGYTKANPTALAGYLAASAQNLNSFMIATAEIDDDMYADALSDFEGLDLEQLQTGLQGLKASNKKGSN